VSIRCETDTVPLLGKRTAVGLRIMTGFGNTGNRILFSVLFTVESICGCSTTYVRVRMEMNLAFSDSEVEIIKILNKGLLLYPISVVPCKRYEAKSGRDVAAIMTCTCLSRASLLHDLPCRP